MAHRGSFDTYEGTLDRVTDVRLGQCRVEVAGRAIRILRFTWTSDTNGDVEAIVDFPIEGILLHLRAIPGTEAQRPDSSYDVFILDQTYRLDADILARQGRNIEGLSLVQGDHPMGRFELAPLVVKEFGMPCVVPSFMLKIENTGAERAGIIQLFWNPRP